MEQGWLRVEGSSMRPLLSPGDEVAVDWDSPHPAREGELILFRGERGEWVVHRVVRGPAAGSGELIAKGDASYCLEPVTADALWGRVVAIRARGARRALSLRPTGLDRWIAGVSRRAAAGSAPGPGTADLGAKLRFRVVFLLSAARRLLLLLRAS